MRDAQRTAIPIPAQFVAGLRYDPDAAMETSLELRCADETALSATLFAPDAAPARATVVLAGAMAVAPAFYTPFARHLASRGLAALTFRYRGMGRQARDSRATIADWGRLDLDAAIGFALSRGRAFAVGHSVGGQILGMAPRASQLSALALVAAQSGWWRWWRGLRRLLMLSLWYGTVPLIAHLLGKMPMRAFGAGEDLPRGVALQWARWCRSRSYLLRDATPESYAAVRAPLLAISIADDPLAPRAAVDWLAGLYGATSRDRVHLAPADAGLRAIGHFGFFREASAPAWPRVSDFLLACG